MASHHPPDEALVAYAAGVGSVGEDLLVASHLEVCPTCRAQVALAESIGGAWLDAGEGPALAPRPVSPAPLSVAPLEDCPVLPSPLRRHTGPLARVAWRSVGLGLRVSALAIPGATERVYLLELPAGFRIPAHGHDGLERALVLGGGYHAEGDGDYVRGDVSWRSDPHGVVHVHPDGPCTTLFVDDGPLDLGNRWLSGLVDRWLGTGRAIS